MFLKILSAILRIFLQVLAPNLCICTAHKPRSKQNESNRGTFVSRKKDVIDWIWITDAMPIIIIWSYEFIFYSYNVCMCILN
jgi:hypothetical protein